MPFRSGPIKGIRSSQGKLTTGKPLTNSKIQQVNLPISEFCKNILFNAENQLLFRKDLKVETENNQVFEDLFEFDNESDSYVDVTVYADTKENLAKLIKVKTIVTLAVIGVFATLSLKGQISADNVMLIVTSVISFYFGTQHEKSK